MSDKKLEGRGIQILVVCAAILAVLILLQKYNKLHWPHMSSATQAPAQNSNTAPIDRSKMTAEQSILTPPNQGATGDEQQAYFSLIQSNAKSADALSLSASCAPSPLVMKLKLNQNFTVKNTDTVDHSIVFDTAHKYTIPAGGSKDLTANFGHNEGIYGYGCDSSSGPVGMMLIEP